MVTGLQSLYQTTWMKGRRRMGQRSSVLHGPPPSPAHRLMQKNPMLPSRYSILAIGQLFSCLRWGSQTCDGVERWVCPVCRSHSQLSVLNALNILGNTGVMCVWRFWFALTVLLLLHVQESVSVDSKFALGQVTSVPKEQNLPMLFNEGENSQVLLTTTNLLPYLML